VPPANENPVIWQFWRVIMMEATCVVHWEIYDGRCGFAGHSERVAGHHRHRKQLWNLEDKNRLSGRRADYGLADRYP
jgi:hypothetical protein